MDAFRQLGAIATIFFVITAAAYAGDYSIIQIGEGSWPQINNLGQVLWKGNDNLLRLYSDGNTIVIPGLTSGVLNDIGDIYYVASSKIYKYKNGQATKLVDCEGECLNLSVNNKGQFVWSDNSGSAKKIILYTDGNATTVRETQVSIIGPSINDSGQITWAEETKQWLSLDAYFDVYLSDNGKNAHIITSEKGLCDIGLIDINNRNQVAWAHNGNISIYGSGVVSKIYTEACFHSYINDSDQIVTYGMTYTPSQQPSPFLYYVALTENGNMTKVADGLPAIPSPRINNKGQITWHANGNIYLRTKKLATSFNFSFIENQQANSPQTIEITAVDQAGAKIQDFNGDVSLSSSVIMNPGNVRLANGHAQFSATFYSQYKANRIHAQYGDYYGDSNYFDVTGAELSSFGGTAVSSSGSKISNANISLSELFGLNVYSTKTSLSGDFYFGPIAPGTYELTATSIDGTQRGKIKNLILRPGLNYKSVTLHMHGRPVLFVPGIFGSTLSGSYSIYPNLAVDPSNDGLQIHNPADIVGWGALRDKLESYGYEVFDVPYDWRLSPGSDQMTSLFKDKIYDALESTGGAWNKVDVVAHSMGGLLVRAYIQGNDFDEANPLIDKFAMVGTPNHGSLDVYALWEGGDCWQADKISQNALSAGDAVKNYLAQNMKSVTLNRLYKNKWGASLLVITPLEHTVLGWLIDPKDSMFPFVRNMPSALALMPTSNKCLYDKSANNDKQPTDKNENTWLKQLNDTSADNGKNLSRIYKTGGIVTTKIFASDDKPTLTKLTVGHSNGEDYYHDGYPGIVDSDKEIAGDGTVPLESALISSVDDDVQHYGGHASLINKFANKIVSFLNFGRNITSSPTKISDMASSTTALSIQSQSPVAVFLTDPNGKKTGVDDTVNAIYYEGENPEVHRYDSNSVANIDNPTSGTYLVKLSGGFADIVFLDIVSIVNGAEQDQSVAIHYPGTASSFTFSLATNETKTIKFPVGKVEGLKTSGSGQIPRSTALRWSTFPGATGYNIYGKLADAPFFTKIATTSDTRYQTNYPWSSPKRLYAVTAIMANGEESFVSDIRENRNYQSIPVPLNPGVLFLLQ